MKIVSGVLLACIVLLTFSVHSAGISRSVFTTEIKNKEPVSELKKIPVDVARIYFFTEFTGLNGHTIIHRWEYNGQVMAELNFQINGDRWRTWSSKNMLSSWVGKWQVSVLDEGGNVIEQSEFEYINSQPDSSTEDTKTKSTDQ